ncbi:nicotinate-nucleotide adenylyltransferase [Crocinitomix algicola]|uniref:nicotinate-nucleotide adenylyltransferase n=1 Tax=Crocinitomix algicola TaxID=1740263 RepID=UPI00082C945F|nr:nicotinate-nucleotide adenylyltransferase [Crocinitomix algicola]
MSKQRRLTTEEKALEINLKQDIYGSFAEIGAGQEVAANFFKAGGSSGTIAYTHSAYDMKVSDSMYGKCSRYVCEERLLQMLEKEYATLETTLHERAKESRFFAFANTVESLNYHKTNQGQGWIGLKFQDAIGQAPNEIVMHIKMHDTSNKRQQEALGILGVNLLHAAYFEHASIEAFLDALTYRLPRSRVEIDMLRVSGADLQYLDNRIIALKLVKMGLTDATMFDQSGQVLQPTTALYKKNVLLMRGRFRPMTKVHVNMIEAGTKLYLDEEDVDEKNTALVLELTLKDLTADGKISDTDFIDRAELLCSMGYTVMISNYLKHYKMIEYLSLITKNKKIGVLLGIYNLQNIFDEKYYNTLNGGLLEAFGRGFGHNIKMYVYPALNVETGDIYDLENFEIPPHLEGLLEYMLKTNKIASIEEFDKKLLHILSDDVLSKIHSGVSNWEEDVPESVMKAIKFYQLFGFREEKFTKPSIEA